MRTIDEIIIHCSATPEGRFVDVATIRKWHTDPKPIGRGWADIGYHYVIYLDGSVHNGRPVTQMGAHCKGHNRYSIGICYVGGVDMFGTPKDTRTPEQKESLRNLIIRLKNEYPGATIHGHYEFARKACPSFKIEDL